MRPLILLTSFATALLILTACNVPARDVHPPIQPTAQEGGGAAYLRAKQRLNYGP